MGLPVNPKKCSSCLAFFCIQSLLFEVHSSTFTVLKYQQVTELHFPLVALFLLYGLFNMMSSPHTHTLVDASAEQELDSGMKRLIPSNDLNLETNYDQVQ